MGRGLTIKLSTTMSGTDFALKASAWWMHTCALTQALMPTHTLSLVGAVLTLAWSWPCMVMLVYGLPASTGRITCELPLWRLAW